MVLSDQAHFLTRGEPLYITKVGERMVKHSDWLPDEHDKLFKLRQLHPEWSYQQLADALTELYGMVFTFNAVRNRIRRHKPNNVKPVATGYKETVEILSDGSHKSDKLLQMDAEQCKDVAFLLKAHGYDVNAWELVSARNNIWNVSDKINGIQTLYSSKITVKPKENIFDWDTFIEQIQNVPSAYITPEYIPNAANYLNIPLFDMHFGISDYEHYKPTQAKVLNILKNHYKETLFIIGSDLFHHNDHRNRTASGREIEHADMVKAWGEAVKFYEPLIIEAIKNSDKVTGIFIKGNHSESLEWSFTKYLEARFPQVTFNTDFKERKVHMLGNNFVGLAHGDKARKRLMELFPAEFPIEWSKATNRDLIIGHLHTEEVIDRGGLTQRALSTRNKIDKYHDDNGYTTSHKRFQIFEYSETELDKIYFV